MNIWLKYGITALLVVIISELAKRSDKLGALVASLPLVTLLTLFWLYVDKQPSEKIANHAYYTFWYVLPTLPMFLLFSYLLPKVGFWADIGICVAVTVAIFWLFAKVLANFGIQLL